MAPLAKVFLVRTALLFAAFALLATEGIAGVLHTFKGGAKDGSLPGGALTISGTHLYGMTGEGGKRNGGTIFRIQTDGKGFKILHHFAGGAKDGAFPTGSLVLSGPKMYGMTSGGGEFDYGVVFRADLDGSNLEVLHSFASGDDGANPDGDLTLEGTQLYGVTPYGGYGENGTLFSIATDGSGYRQLHVFDGVREGSNPECPPVVVGGQLYGTTNTGGIVEGVLYSIGIDGGGFAIQHTFTGNCIFPRGTLVFDGAKFYGITEGGGAVDAGTVYSIDPNGRNLAILHEFSEQPDDGNIPQSGLQLINGLLYGTTYVGGPAMSGTVFSISVDGSGFGLVKSFAGKPHDGALLYGNVTVALDGRDLFGMAIAGGKKDLGVIYSLGSGSEPPELPLVWGARVRITTVDDESWEDLFVATDGESLITASDVTVDAGGVVTIEPTAIPLSSVRNIAVISDPGWPGGHPDLETYGFNKFCSPAYDAAVEIAGPHAWKAGQGWTVVNTASGKLVHLPAGSALYAVPRCAPPSDWTPPRARTAATDLGIRNTIAQQSAKLSIPPMILFGKLWEESHGKFELDATETGPAKKVGVGWNQYGFMTVRKTPGKPGGALPRRTDPEGGERTLVTYDGGIGIGQITGRTALGLTPQGNAATTVDILTHLYALSNDLAYNVQAAAQVLDSKRETVVDSFNAPIGDLESTQGKSVIENWYNAIWAYNGYPNRATLKNTALKKGQTDFYPDQIENFISGGGDGRWVFWDANGPGRYKVPVPGHPGHFYAAAQPTLGGTGVPGRKAAHADPDLDGQMDVVLTDAEFSSETAGDVLSVDLAVDPHRTLAIDSVTATITGGALADGASVAVTLTAGTGGKYTGVSAQHFALPSSHPYVATFVVKVSGLPGGSATTGGITFQFKVPEGTH